LRVEDVEIIDEKSESPDVVVAVAVEFAAGAHSLKFAFTNAVADTGASC
jgi:hypothetical protein